MDFNLFWTIIYGAICGYVASRILGVKVLAFLATLSLAFGWSDWTQSFPLDEMEH